MASEALPHHEVLQLWCGVISTLCGRYYHIATLASGALMHANNDHIELPTHLSTHRGQRILCAVWWKLCERIVRHPAYSQNYFLNWLGVHLSSESSCACCDDDDDDDEEEEADRTECFIRLLATEWSLAGQLPSTRAAAIEPSARTTVLLCEEPCGGMVPPWHLRLEHCLNRAVWLSRRISYPSRVTDGATAQETPSTHRKKPFGGAWLALHPLKSQHVQKTTHDVDDKYVPWEQVPCNCEEFDQCTLIALSARLYAMQCMEETSIRRLTMEMERQNATWWDYDDRSDSLTPTGDTVCSRCLRTGLSVSKHRIQTRFAQKRSIDEGQTAFHQCLVCGHSWKQNT